MSNRISKHEAEKRRTAYRDAHRFSWAPILGTKGWSLSLKKPIVVHHMAGGRLIDEYECPANYFPIADFPVADEHKGWAHGLDPDSIKPFWNHDGRWQAQARLQCWALKFMAGETPIEIAEYLMKKRGLDWWFVDMHAKTTFEDVIMAAVARFSMDIKLFPC